MRGVSAVSVPRTWFGLSMKLGLHEGRGRSSQEMSLIVRSTKSYSKAFFTVVTVTHRDNRYCMMQRTKDLWLSLLFQTHLV